MSAEIDRRLAEARITAPRASDTPVRRPGEARAPWQPPPRAGYFVRRMKIAPLFIACALASALAPLPKAHAEEGSLVPQIRQGRVEQMAIDPAGTLLAALGRDSVQLWDLATGRVIRTWSLPIDIGSPVRVAFTPKGTVLVSGKRNVEADPATGELRDLQSAAGSAPVELPAAQRITAADPSGRFVAQATDQSIVLERPNGAVLRTLETPAGTPIGQVRFSGDGRFIRLRDSSLRSRELDLGTGRQSHIGPLMTSAAAVATDEEGASSVTIERTTGNPIIVRRGNDAKRIADATSFKAGRDALAMSPEGGFIAYSSFGGEVVVVRSVANGAASELKVPTGAAQVIALSREAKIVAVAGVFEYAGEKPTLYVTVRDPTGSKEIVTHRAEHPGPRGDVITAVELSPDGSMLAFASRSGLVASLPIRASAAPVVLRSAHDRPLNADRSPALAFSPDGGLGDEVPDRQRLAVLGIVVRDDDRAIAPRVDRVAVRISAERDFVSGAEPARDLDRAFRVHGPGKEHSAETVL
jgi:WD40 repeat protein